LFKPLTLKEIETIVDHLVKTISARLSERHITLTLSPEAKTFVAEAGYDPVYGARPLKRYLQRELDTKIGRALIAGDVEDGTEIKVSVKNKALQFEFLKGKTESSKKASSRS
jgi:ATP-dependent Clp protease ATP-binding subunit ClpB